MRELIHFNKAKYALAKASRIDEVKRIRDKAEAARAYAIQSNESFLMQNQCAEIKVRAERRCGEILKDMEKAKGGNPKLTNRSQSATSSKTLRDIGINKTQSSRWQAIAKIPEGKFEKFISQNIKEERAITSAQALRLLESIEQEKNHKKANKNKNSFPKGKFATLVIDPPWPMQKIKRDTRPNQVGFDYPTMDENQLMVFPIEKISATDSHLYLWVTHKYLPMGLRLVDAWGFKYQCLLSWVKNVGMTPFSWMYSTEHIIFAKKGNLKLKKLGKRLDFKAKVRQHSRKPDEFYDLVKEVSPTPRIDIFSREKRRGFFQYGNESEKF